MPITFSGLYMSWFFDPHVGYIVDSLGTTYYNVLQLFNNAMICFGLSGLYLLFAISLWIKRSSIAATVGVVQGEHHGEGVVHSLVGAIGWARL